MNHQRATDHQRQRRKWRVRKRIRGTSERPRLCVVRSLKHIYVQLIDDESGRTLAAASSRETEIAGKTAGGNRAAAELVGKAIADRAAAAGIKQAAFDRGHCKYHGRVAALAEKAREAGLSI